MKYCREKFSIILLDDRLIFEKKIKYSMYHQIDQIYIIDKISVHVRREKKGKILANGGRI